MCGKVTKRRKFKDFWLADDRFKSWLRKVPLDNTLCRCIICNTTFLCYSSHIKRHMISRKHKDNKSTSIQIEKSASLINSDKLTSIKKTHKAAMFRQQWLDIEQFKSWLREVPYNPYLFACSICGKSIAGGLSQVHRHAYSKMHMNNYIRCSKGTSMSNERINMRNNESILPFDQRKKSAEIRFAALMAEKDISYDCAQIVLRFFQNVGKDPNILKSMSMDQTNCTNIISQVLCPVEIDHIMQNIQNTKVSLFIDETSNILNEKKMTFHVRYVNAETLNVHLQLIKLIDIDAGDCCADKLFNAFKQEMQKLQIPLGNIIALSCNNTSVITGRYLAFKKKLEQICKNLLTFSCPCYSAALVAHDACCKIPPTCEKFIKKVTNYVNSNPKGWAIFLDFTDCFQERSYKILKFCETRWISRYSCVQKLLESWDSIYHFLNEVVMSEKTKSGEYLLSMMENVQIKAYLLFLHYILQFFNEFYEFFQATETRIHLLHLKSLDFLVTICENFIKRELLENIPNIIFSQSENHKSLNDINLGYECEEYLKELLNDRKSDTDEVANIRENCLQFYITAAEGICKRLPINDQFLCKLKIFQSYIALFDIDRETSFNDLAFVAKTINCFDEDNLKKEWLTLHLHFTKTEKQKLSNLNFDNMWKEILQYKTNLIKYPNLKAIINAVKSLPNSNTDPESICSFLTGVKTQKRSKLLSSNVNDICVVKSALNTKEETILNMKIDEKHLSLIMTDK